MRATTIPNRPQPIDPELPKQIGDYQKGGVRYAGRPGGGSCDGAADHRRGRLIPKRLRRQRWSSLPARLLRRAPPEQYHGRQMQTGVVGH